MVATGEAADHRPRNQFRVKLQMCEGNDVIGGAVIEEQGYAAGETLGEIRARLHFIARPSAIADERRGDERNGPQPSLRRELGEEMDQDCPADGMADEDRVILQLVELLEQRGLPGP
jgi:hypothetical protein